MKVWVIKVSKGEETGLKLIKGSNKKRTGKQGDKTSVA